MNLLTRDQVKTLIVKPSLKAVADFDGDFENYTFEHFHGFSMAIFRKKLKENLKSKGYNVALNDQIVEGWETLKDCIEYIYDEHFEL